MCYKKVEKEFLREIRIGFSGPNKPLITRRSSCCIAKGRILVDHDGEGGHWRSDTPQDGRGGDPKNILRSSFSSLFRP